MCKKCEKLIERRGFLKSTFTATASLMAVNLLSHETLAATITDFPEGGKIDGLIQSGKAEIKNGEHHVIDVFISHPKKEGTFKTVIIAHGFGDTTYLEYTATRLALAGFGAISILGERKTSTTEDSQIPQRKRLFPATIDFISTLRNMSHDEIGVLGFCGAGTGAMKLAAVNPKIRAAVSVYGDMTESDSVLSPGTIEKIVIPVQAHFGLLDEVFPMASAKNFETKILSRNKNASVYFYENCGHSYCNFSISEGTERGFDYNFDAAMKTYERIIDFFRRYL